MDLAGKLSGCGRASAHSYTDTSYVRVLQHMATLAGTEAHRKPPGASRKRRVPRACQLLRSGEDHLSQWTRRSFSIQPTEQQGRHALVPWNPFLLTPASAQTTAHEWLLPYQRK